MNASEKKDTAPSLNDEMKTDDALQSAEASEEATPDPTKMFEQQLKDQEDKFLRLYADFENFRRRSLKEQQALVLSASKDLITVLLPVIDDFERAMANNEKLEDPSALKEGFGLIHSKLMGILNSKGLKAMDAVDSDFNYELHEAIAKVPTEDQSKKGKVIDQVEKGYYLNDLVIRYAKVVVGE